MTEGRPRKVGRPRRARGDLRQLPVKLDAELIALATKRAAELKRSFAGHVAMLLARDLGKRPEAFGHDV